MQKKITILLLVMFVASFFVFLVPVNANQSVTIAYNTGSASSQYFLTDVYGDPSHIYVSSVREKVVPSTNSYLDLFSWQLFRQTYATNCVIKASLLNSSGLCIENSTTVLNSSDLPVCASYQGNATVKPAYFQFQFSGTTLMQSGGTYYLQLYVYSAVLIDYTNNGVGICLTISGYSYSMEQWERESGTWAFRSVGSAYANFLCAGWLTQATPTPAPTTPPPPNGTVAVNFFVNDGSTTTSTYSTHANITWQLPSSEGFTTPVIGNNGGGTLYLNDGTDGFYLKTQIATGYYFWNFTCITDEVIRYSTVNTWAIGLHTTESYVWGTTYNITLYVSTTPNVATITLNNGVHGSIYMQYIYGESVQDGTTGDVISGSDTTKYGAGTYTLQYGTTLHIGALCDTGYKVSYYDEYAGGIHSKITALPLTIIVTTNMTITAYYVIDAGDGSNVNYDNSALSGFFVIFLLLFVPPMCIAGTLGAITRSGAGAAIGFICGFILMLIVGVIVGFLPFWAVIVIALVLVIILWVVIRGVLN